MANIMINEKCNLKCPYCFANEFTLDRVTKNMSIDDFKYALEFALSSGTQRIGIIGGEPTLHPQFEEIMKILRNDDRVQHAVLFTNGTNMEKYAKLLIPRKFTVLINYNSPKDTGDRLFEIVRKNIEVAINEYNLGERINFGINMYKENFDYEYLIEELKKYNKKTLRVSISMPMNVREVDPIDHMEKMKPSVFKFFMELDKIGVLPHYDCNLMPPCVTTLEEKQWLNKLKVKYISEDFNLDKAPVCNPVIDITVDMLAIRCFGLSEETKADIRQFENIEDLFRFYQVQIDSFSSIVTASERCKTCALSMMGKCFGGCLAHKIKKIESARLHIQNNN